MHGGVGRHRGAPPRLRHVHKVTGAELLGRLRTGNVANIKFGDLQTLVEACGFELDRVTGSHHIYRHPDIPVRLDLQNVRGQTKPYQVRQVLRALERYDLVPEDLG